MTRRHTAHEHVRQAAQLVKAAADQWKATDLAAVENCLSVLELSAAALTAGLEILRRSPESAGGALRAELSGLKEDACRLQRLADAAAAFLRSLPGAPCADAELYQPGGRTSPMVSAPEWGMQG
jgi:hypothetical protein